MSTKILAHERISLKPKPQAWIFFLHGFLGSGQNWRSFARKLINLKPELGAVLVDLRLHGDSQNFKPPHTLKAASQDLIELAREFQEPVSHVVGHSFGAKVALTFVERFHENLKSAWLIDAPMWALENNINNYINNILNILENLSHKIFATRQIFIAHLEHAGIKHEIAQWLAMNLRDNNSGFYVQLSPENLRNLIQDYYKQDLLYIFSNNLIKTNISYVLGEKSETLSAHDRDKITMLAHKYPSRMQSYVIKKAGHYVHVDCPSELLALMARIL